MVRGLLVLLAILMGGSSVLAQTAPKIQRFPIVTGLRPEYEARYRELHAHPWPAVQAQITRSKIQNFTIFVASLKGEKYLFGHFEYLGSDFAADMAAMAADAETQRWWKETDACQKPLPEAVEKKKIWADMDLVFHHDGAVHSEPPRRIGTVAPVDAARVAILRAQATNPAAEWAAWLRAARFSNYNLAVKDIAGQPYLFAFWNYHGQNLAHDLAAARALPSADRWFEAYHSGLGDLLTAASSRKATSLELVYYQP